MCVIERILYIVLICPSYRYFKRTWRAASALVNLIILVTTDKRCHRNVIPTPLLIFFFVHLLLLLLPITTTSNLIRFYYILKTSHFFSLFLLLRLRLPLLLLLLYSSLDFLIVRSFRILRRWLADFLEI